MGQDTLLRFSTNQNHDQSAECMTMNYKGSDESIWNPVTLNNLSVDEQDKSRVFYDEISP